jgi:hypothetical protein
MYLEPDESKASPLLHLKIDCQLHHAEYSFRYSSETKSRRASHY